MWSPLVFYLLHHLNIRQWLFFPTICHACYKPCKKCVLDYNLVTYEITAEENHFLTIILFILPKLHF